MKAVVYVAGFLGLATASPPVILPRSLPAVPGYDASLGMQWIGEVFPGKNYTLYGDAKTIYEQVLKINPDYVAVPIPDIQTRSLVPRNKNQGFCGNFPTGREFDIHDQMNYLVNLGGRCNVNAKACIRMTCTNTSGTYLCNDNSYAISPSCKYLSGYVSDIDFCCNGMSTDPRGAAISGQEFDTDGYNVVAAYSNCQHSPSQKPSEYGGSGNGSPAKVCSHCVSANHGDCNN